MVPSAYIDTGKDHRRSFFREEGALNAGSWLPSMEQGGPAIEKPDTAGAGIVSGPYKSPCSCYFIKKFNAINLSLYVLLHLCHDAVIDLGPKEMVFANHGLKALKITPLHYACAYGNPAVVALLVKRKCNVDLYDSDGNTPLMKALQYEEEECAILLLEHGANPNVHNNKGETPLHCAIFYRSTSVATKLLSFNADIEAKNTSGQTPLLFAIKKKRQMMVEFFINNKANIHAVDDKGRTALMFAVEHKSTQIAELLLQCGVNVSASDKCGRIALSYAIASGSTASPEKSDPGDSCLAKGEGNYEAHIKNILEEGGKLTKASRQSMKDEAKYDTGNQRSENLPDSSTPASQKKEVVETTLVQAIRIKNDSPFFPSPDSKIPQNDVGHLPGDAHQTAKDDVNGHIEATNRGVDHGASEGTPTRGLAPRTVPMASRDASECTKHAEPPVTVKEPDPCPGPGKAEAETVRSAENLFDVTSEEEHESSDDTQHSQPQIFSEAHPQMQVSHSSSEKQHRAKEETDRHDRASRDASECTKHTEPPVTVKEPDPCPGPGKAEAETVRSAFHALTVSCFLAATRLWHLSAPPCKKTTISGTFSLPAQVLVPLTARHTGSPSPFQPESHGGSRKSNPVTPQNTGEEEEDAQEEPASHRASRDASECTKHTEPPVTVKEPIPCPGPGKAEAETVRSAAEKLFTHFLGLHTVAQLRMQLALGHRFPTLSPSFMWKFKCALKEEAKRRNDELLREKNKDQLKEKEAEYNKEDKVRKQAEISVDTLGMKLRTARNHFDQIPTRDESDNKPLHKYHKTKDEISMRRLGMDPIKYQDQEKKCLKNTEILTEKNVDLPRTDKMNEKTLTKTFQDNEQLDIWKAESTLQNCTLESEKQSTERPETEVKSHPARPGAAPHHQGESPTPKRNLELAFQRARDKDFSSQEEKNIDVINLEVSSEIPSQQAPKSEIKTSDLENELRKTRGTLRVMTLATEQVNRHLKQRQCQLKGMEHGYQNEQRKRNAHLRKQEASREKVSKLQSETTLLKDQLHDYQNKANDKKDEIINIQTQFQDIIKRIQAQNDKHYLMLENEYMELTSETNHLKEQLDQYGKEKEVKYNLSSSKYNLDLIPSANK
ncbi:ankyrin repeat domain-containing protein 26-like [Marmota flaviventris]|uniref:ankyrin repeat domain-containing protein 26-like n=1 Tax=Marmota flaviventris TaxID=93162 RepID=UPI003A88DE8B